LLRAAFLLVFSIWSCCFPLRVFCFLCEHTTPPTPFIPPPQNQHKLNPKGLQLNPQGFHSLFQSTRTHPSMQNPSHAVASRTGACPSSGQTGAPLVNAVTAPPACEPISTTLYRIEQYRTKLTNKSFTKDELVHVRAHLDFLIAHANTLPAAVRLMVTSLRLEAYKQLGIELHTGPVNTSTASLVSNAVTVHQRLHTSPSIIQIASANIHRAGSTVCASAPGGGATRSTMQTNQLAVVTSQLNSVRANTPLKPTARAVNTRPSQSYEQFAAAMAAAREASVRSRVDAELAAVRAASMQPQAPLPVPLLALVNAQIASSRQANGDPIARVSEVTTEEHATRVHAAIHARNLRAARKRVFEAAATSFPPTESDTQRTHQACIDAFCEATQDCTSCMTVSNSELGNDYIKTCACM
jgi:hypothetical protein